MQLKPNDTSPEAWAVRADVLRRMGGDARVRTALDLSEAVREIQVQGLLSRNPTWQRRDAIRYLVRKQFGVDLEQSL